MGSCCSSGDRVGPEDATATELSTPGKRDKNATEFEGPTKDRGCTDICFLFIMFAFLISLVALISYCATYADMYRIINGYDNCGNVCGRKNPYVKEYDRKEYCIGEDKTDKKSWITNCESKECKQRMCSFLWIKFEVVEDLHMSWREILYLCLIALGFSIILLILFRFLVGIVVWLVLIGVTIASIVGTIYLWILWKAKKDEAGKAKTNEEIEQITTKSYLAYAIIATIVTVIVLLVILVMRKRIKLVVELFKEAGKAVASMPVLLVEPIVTFVALGLVVAAWLIFCVVIESSGILKQSKSEPATYEKDTTMKVTRWYNLLGLFWFAQFCIGCQHMIIAGAVSKWFFTRNKNNLGFPVVRSTFNLIRYHLGTVAMGSLVIALVQLVRTIIAAVQYQVKGHDNALSKCLFRTCQCCLYCFEKILKYLTRGQQAFKHLSTNALRVAAINSVGDFVLFLGKALVVVATILIGIKMFDSKEGINHVWVPLGLVGIFAYLVSHCFVTVYEMAIDTIFLCFCEDCEQNDGLSRPYFMSRGLMEFVQNSKKVLDVKDDSESPQSQAWSTTSTRQAASGK
ncbi:hypothetical protein C0J52_03676 [Blattella germanica]|nr:hypothetical protein C0J52_03676 [Blattella germanica]